MASPLLWRKVWRRGLGFAAIMTVVMLYLRPELPTDSVAGLTNPLRLLAAEREREMLRVSREQSMGGEFNGTSTAELRSLLHDKAENGLVVMMGFNGGYEDMLLNALCRLEQLRVKQYIIAAFDAAAYGVCVTRALPCFRVGSQWYDAKESSAYTFRSEGFKHMTKLKSKQVLRVLELGYDVLFTDVDIFWKADPIVDMYTDAQGYDMVIQSDSGKGGSPKSNLNSGFYLVKASPRSIKGFGEIVTLAEQTQNKTEQPAFKAVLCKSDQKPDLSERTCDNQRIPFRLRVLPPKRYPNGSQTRQGAPLAHVTPTSKDGVMIVHFNWMKGYEAKRQAMERRHMWLLTEDRKCRQGPVRLLKKKAKS